MSGHSKWATIKRAKGAADAKRGALFSRLSKDITVAVRLGDSGDITFNPMLKVAVDKAKSSNMPSDKIDKAIKKGLGVSDSNDTENFENTYEVYAPHGVAVLIDTETDNPNRTLTDIKTTVNRNGGKLASEGSLSWQFEEIGQISAKVKSEEDIDTLSLELLDIEGITDFKLEEEINDEDEAQMILKILIDRSKLKSVNDALKAQFSDRLSVDSISLIKLSKNQQDLEEKELNDVKGFVEKLEELSDVTNVWTNLKN